MYASTSAGNPRFSKRLSEKFSTWFRLRDCCFNLRSKCRSTGNARAGSAVLQKAGPPSYNLCMLQQVLQTIESRKHQSLALLKEFLSIPSVSANPEHTADMQRC